MAAVAIRMRADAGRASAGQLQSDITSVAAVTTDLAAAETGEDDDGLR
jgi:hypothetical protein